MALSRDTGELRVNGLLDLVRDGLMLAVTLGLPLLAVGLVAGMLAGWLAQLTGIADPGVSAALRAAAVVGALWATGGWIASRVTELADDAWGRIGALGRDGIPRPPSSGLDQPNPPLVPRG